jgi:hypothetical protein
VSRQAARNRTLTDYLRGPIRQAGVAHLQNDEPLPRSYYSKLVLNTVFVITAVASLCTYPSAFHQRPAWTGMMSCPSNGVRGRRDSYHGILYCEYTPTYAFIGQSSLNRSQPLFRLFRVGE